MSDHTESLSSSADLCDALYTGLAKRIPNLKRSQSYRWCAFFQEGSPRFAYVSHRKKSSRIEVWCRGEFEVLAARSPLTFHPRKPTSGGFGREFEARFFVDDAAQLPAAIQILYDVSYQR